MLNGKELGNGTHWMRTNQLALETELFVVDVSVPERAAVVKLVRGQCWLGRAIAMALMDMGTVCWCASLSCCFN